MQDFSDEEHEERSLAVIMFDTSIENKILNLAKNRRISVDLQNEVPEWKINDIIKKELEYLYIPEFKNVISYDFDGVLHKSYNHFWMKQQPRYDL